eukprot:CAMPEP_0197436448 /NCGR_PEP_ID=MMETSP1175-20131217/3893_1 /TAXON_ID=1003142 /ORGANISM="Triceratium dubium, Strain CCMP147" /LENGTH=77 /DNA_ID=CAMNT_0042965741 /DNA_START=197 /DNA_END=430 /DNA_ORIENTATION=-
MEWNGDSAKRVWNMANTALGKTERDDYGPTMTSLEGEIVAGDEERNGRGRRKRGRRSGLAPFRVLMTKVPRGRAGRE